MTFEDWKIEHLRLTIFTAAAVGLDATEIYKSCFSIAPVETRSKPATSQSTAVGDFDGRVAEIHSFLDRVDIILKPHPKDHIFPELGFFSETSKTLDQFKNKFSNWLSMSHLKIKRLAIGVNVFLPQTSKDIEFKYLSKYIDDVLMIKTDKISDLNFIYNNWVYSRIKNDFKINRISNVKVLKFVKITEGFLGNNPVKERVENFYFNLMLDYNTDVDYEDEIPVPTLLLYFDELLLNINKSLAKIF